MLKFPEILKTLSNILNFFSNFFEFSWNVSSLLQFLGIALIFFKKYLNFLKFLQISLKLPWIFLQNQDQHSKIIYGPRKNHLRHNIRKPTNNTNGKWWIVVPKLQNSLSHSIQLTTFKLFSFSLFWYASQVPAFPQNRYILLALFSENSINGKSINWFTI